MSLTRLSRYFSNLADKYSDFRFLIGSAINKLILRDSRDQAATLDVIAQRSICESLRNGGSFRGYCKVAEQTFYKRLYERTKPFNLMERRTLKAKAARSQLTVFKEQVSSSTLSTASALVSEHLGLNRKFLKPASVDEAAQSLKLQTSAGFPWFVKKGECLSEIINSASYFYNERNWDPLYLAKFPTYIAYRVQQRASDVKLRLIYVYSGLIVVLEQLFLTPLLSYFLQNKFSPYVIGNVGSDLIFRWNKWQGRDKIVSIDWSGFDWSASRLLIMESFNILKNSFHLTPFQALVFDFVAHYFVDTPIVTNVDTGELTLISKVRGVPSGSSFTNLIDSIVNMLALYCYLLEMGYEINPELIAVLGDDVVLATNAPFSLQHFSSWAERVLGMSVSVEKSQVFRRGERVYFLGAYFDACGRYANPELLLYQICSTTSNLFVKCESSRDHAIRLWDKCCSICFKYSDGYVVFDAIWPYIENYLGVSYFSDSYAEIVSRATVPGSDDPSLGTTRNFWTMRELGWFIQ